MSSIYQQPSAEGAAVLERIAVVNGRINALHGELVRLTAEAREHGVWGGDGLEAPGAWASLITGATRATGRKVQALADRSAELPETIAALTSGRMSLDQAAVIAEHVPAWGEQRMVDLAQYATVAQMRRAATAYPRDEPTPQESTRVRGVRRHAHSDGFTTIEATLHHDAAESVAAGLDAELDRLHAEHDPDSDHDLPDRADALVAMAARSLGAEEIERPHARPRIVLHVDVDPDGAGRATWHGGDHVPASIRRQLGCDADVETWVERHGTPVGLGRKTRVVSDKLRMIIEHRDRGCRVPGCGSRFVQIHHLVHWEHGGSTDTANLISLCPRHHRAHHAGELHIDHGDADQDPVIFRNRWGQPLLAAVSPTAPDPPGSDPPRSVPPRYTHPTGERWDATNFSTGPPPAPPPARPPEADAA